MEMEEEIMDALPMLFQKRMEFETLRMMSLLRGR